MTITRRAFLRTTAALGAGGAIAGIDAATPAAAGAVGVEQTTAEATRHFTANGYVAVAPVPLVTGIPFNGGLNYDERLAAASNAACVVQRCARVEDAQKPDKTGTLPLFTMFGFCPAAQAAQPHRTRLLFEFLTGVAGLDPNRLRITTTALARPLFPTFAGFGVREAQIRMRPEDEARRQGAGSGWFAPAGHPDRPSFATYSVEYVLRNGVELEIAEVAVAAEAPHHGGGGIGLERLTMARTDRLITWNETLPAFRKAVETDARSGGKPLPSGYYAILGLPQPGGKG